MEPLDWGEGNYARTAAALAPASEALVEFAGIEAGQKVLDVACGTGNAALAAAERGADGHRRGPGGRRWSNRPRPGRRSAASSAAGSAAAPTSCRWPTARSTSR